MKFIESQSVELKSIFTSDIKKEIVAFLNTHGGKIYIGINDFGEVIGLESGKKVIEQITSMIHDTIKPDATLFCKVSCIHINNKDIVEIDIIRGNKLPYYIYENGIKPSGVYIRMGTSSIQASEYAIKQMIMQYEGESFELIRSLEQHLTFNYLSNIFGQVNLEFNAQKMKSLHLVNSDNLYTNLALLLSDQCPFTIKIAIFYGNTKLEFKDRKEFCGSLIKQVDEIYSYLKLINKVKSNYEDLKRVDSHDYNNLILREGLLNSVIHRDYSLNGSNLINIFDDRIEFVSIGGLVKGMTYNDMMIGVSRTRNEKLANIFLKLTYVDAYGTGIGKIQAEYMHSNNKPEFIPSDNGFLLVIPNKNFELDETNDFSIEEDIYTYFKINQKVTRAEIQNQFDLKLTKTTKILNQLEAKNKIIRIGKGKNTYYRIK